MNGWEIRLPNDANSPQRRREHRGLAEIRRERKRGVYFTSSSLCETSAALCASAVN
jgi:hypothetical protein